MRRQPGTARTDAPQGPGSTPGGPAEEHDGPTGAPRPDGTAPDAGQPADEPPTEPPTQPPAGSDPAGRRGPVRRVLAVVLTVLAVLLVLAALVAPDTMAVLPPLAFVRIPLEALVLIALALVLPGRAGKLLAAVVGVLLGLLTVLKLFDIGYSAALNRMFDP